MLFASEEFYSLLWKSYSRYSIIAYRIGCAEKVERRLLLEERLGVSFRQWLVIGCRGHYWRHKRLEEKRRMHVIDRLGRGKIRTDPNYVAFSYFLPACALCFCRFGILVYCFSELSEHSCVLSGDGYFGCSTYFIFFPL